MLLKRSLVVVLWGGSVGGGWLYAPLVEREQMAHVAPMPNANKTNREDVTAGRCWWPLVERIEQFTVAGSHTVPEGPVRGLLFVQGRSFTIRQDRDGHLYRALASTPMRVPDSHNHNAAINTGIIDEQMGEAARRMADASDGIPRCTGIGTALSKHDIARNSDAHNHQRLPSSSS